MSSNINSNGHSKSFLLNNFMNILQNFNDLWHDNYFFHNFFQNIGNLY